MQALTLPVTQGGALAQLTNSEVEFVTDLMEQYQQEKKDITLIHVFMENNHKPKNIEHFIFGNIKTQDNYEIANGMDNLFKLNGALDSLNSTYWWRLMAKLNFRDSIAPVLAKEWDNIIQANVTPSFEAQSVSQALQELLESRQNEFVRRVDTAFKKLSGIKKPGLSFSFDNKMLIEDIKIGAGLSPGKLTIICELRILLNELLGRADQQVNTTFKNVEALFEHCDEWHAMDGGALRLKACANGHLEVVIHPSLAHQLNITLAPLYPDATQLNNAKASSVDPIINMIEPGVINFITEGVFFDTKTYRLKLHADSRGEIAKSARHLLESLGGEFTGQHYQFDYDPRAEFKRIAISGVMPCVA